MGDGQMDQDQGVVEAFLRATWQQAEDGIVAVLAVLAVLAASAAAVLAVGCLECRGGSWETPWDFAAAAVAEDMVQVVVQGVVQVVQGAASAVAWEAWPGQGESPAVASDRMPSTKTRWMGRIGRRKRGGKMDGEKERDGMRRGERKEQRKRNKRKEMTIARARPMNDTTSSRSE